jgi:hypothetical protein
MRMIFLAFVAFLVAVAGIPCLGCQISTQKTVAAKAPVCECCRHNAPAQPVSGNQPKKCSGVCCTPAPANRAADNGPAIAPHVATSTIQSIVLCRISFSNASRNIEVGSLLSNQCSLLSLHCALIG